MDEATRNEAIRRWLRGESQRSIGRRLGLSRPTVRALVVQHEQQRQAGAPAIAPARPRASRSSLLDAYAAQIAQLLARYPRITATRLCEELRAAGYTGGYSTVRDHVRELRGAAAPAVVQRFETSPGAQAQMDWSVYELEFTGEGRRRVNLFSYILGYSRRQYVCFTENQDMETTLREHIRAFRHLGGVAATCLYDNMKVVVTRWEDDEPIYNPRFLSFATHYGYRPRACWPRRPQTKGKVERPFFYVETSLLNGRTFRSLEHLNEVARWWLENVADTHVHGTTKRRPVDAHAEELPHLLPLPAHDYDTSRVVYRLLEEDGFIRYQSNEYSAPWRYLGRTLPVRITETELIVYNLEIEPIARHLLYPASLTGQRREEPTHRPPRDVKQQVDLLRQRFAAWGAAGEKFLTGLLAQHRHGKALAHKTLVLARCYHQADVVAALERAVRYQAFSYTSLERILTAQAEPKPAWPTLADGDATLDGLGQLPLVLPRSTADYQHLLTSPEECHGPFVPPEPPPPTDSAAPEPAARDRGLPDGADPRASGDAADSADGRGAG